MERKVYASKTYYFLEPTECCPYLSGCNCELRKIDICKRDKYFYKDTCCTSKYARKCSHFVDKVRTIKKNSYFRASYCCPYLAKNVCKLREVNMSANNNKVYRFTCSTTDYIYKCPHFLEKIVDYKCKAGTTVYESCPYRDGDWCKVRKINVKDNCYDFYKHCCSKSNYIKCCPYYVKEACT